MSPAAVPPMCESLRQPQSESAEYRLLLVIPDRAQLCRLSEFVEELGFSTAQACDAEQAVRAAEAFMPDLVVLEQSLASAGKGDLRPAMEDAALQPALYFWLGDCRPGDNVRSALVAGFDDFLHLPVSHGELVSRLRAGAARLEFERRWRSQRVRDPLTGLPTQASLAARLKRIEESSQGRKTTTSCVLLEIDYFDRFVSKLGLRAAERLLASIAGELAALTPTAAEWRRIGDRFAALLFDHSAAEAVAWAERLAKTVALREFQAGEETVRISISQGVAEFTADDATGEELLRRAAAALEQARRCGRGGVSRFDANLARRSSVPPDSAIAAGQRFVQSPARDFMSPCTVILNPSDSATLAFRLLHQGGYEALPVADERGRLIGLVTAEGQGSHDGATPGNVADIMASQPPHRDETTEFPALLEFFTQSAHSWLTITRQGAPIGLISRDRLASLAAPLSRQEFSSTAPLSLNSDYLFFGAGQASAI